MEPGLVLVVGPNGVGKTNLLEGIHMAAQGFSPRTRSESEVLRFGTEAGVAAVRGSRGGRRVDIEVRLRARETKRASVNDVALRAAEQLRSEVNALVFTPDRLAVVKGAPAVRRSYVDRAIGRVWPARSTLSVEYAAAIGQRNAALRRAAAGFSSREALTPWTAQVAELGARLVTARRELVDELAHPFRRTAASLELADAEAHYDGVEPTVEALESRLDRDLERGATGLGPHLDDVAITAEGRDLRTYGSQGEQRLAVLSLLLAEAEVLTARRGVPPLLLLDDVLSELDERRRRALADRVARDGQALLTTTSAAALPAEPAALVEVSPGIARRVV